MVGQRYKLHFVDTHTNGDYKDFEQTLGNVYEALSDAGGFLLLRSSRNGSGENRPLDLIPIPYEGLYHTIFEI